MKNDAWEVIQQRIKDDPAFRVKGKAPFRRCPDYTRRQRLRMKADSEGLPFNRPPYQLIAFADIDQQYSYGFEPFQAVGDEVWAVRHETLAGAAAAFRALRPTGRWCVWIQPGDPDGMLLMDTLVLDLYLEEEGDEPRADDEA